MFDLSQLDMLAWILVFAVSILAGALNAMSGGGGMLVVPTLLMLGVPPVNAIATNKFQNTIGSISANWQYFKSGMLSRAHFGITIPIAGFCAFLGAIALQWFAARDWLAWILPWVLIAVALYMAFPERVAKLKPQDPDAKRLDIRPISAVFGFYGGFLGLATGPMLVAAHAWINEIDIRQSMAQAKPIIFAINCVSFITLAIGGHLWLTVGIVMAVGSSLGASIGSKLVINNHLQWVKPIVVVVPLVAALQMFWQTLVPLLFN